MGYSNRTFICPFYVRDHRDKMRCEGGTVRLADLRSTLRYMNSYCASYDWERCTLARALEEFYEGREKA